MKLSKWFCVFFACFFLFFFSFGKGDALAQCSFPVFVEFDGHAFAQQFARYTCRRDRGRTLMS